MPAPLLFLAFMGVQGRYFGRWLLPIFPILCLLAAFFAMAAGRDDRSSRLAGAGAARSRRAAHAAVVAVLVLALCGQGLFYSVHADLVLSRADTRNADAGVDGRAHPCRHARSWWSRSRRRTGGRAG